MGLGLGLGLRLGFRVGLALAGPNAVVVGGRLETCEAFVLRIYLKLRLKKKQSWVILFPDPVLAILRWVAPTRVTRMSPYTRRVWLGAWRCVGKSQSCNRNDDTPTTS